MPVPESLRGPRGESRAIIAGPAGALEVALNLPADDGAEARGIALVAHPHPQQGGTLDNKVAQTLARTFAGLRYVAVRFNFRGAGGSEGVFDDGRGETDDALAALAYGRGAFPALATRPPVLAGFSFGTFVQTRVARAVAPERLVLIAPAVARFPSETVPADTIVIHGEEDDVVALADVLAWARPQQLPVTVFPGCGHFFHGRLPQLQRTIAGTWQR
ncbi:MAG TPA: CocE/NonD family hydrolase [Casimicrobiaceae bacterium]|nr:CocE/NonD family hydrolase [Casimicrobiaceae bacterium]